MDGAATKRGPVPLDMAPIAGSLKVPAGSSGVPVRSFDEAGRCYQSNGTGVTGGGAQGRNIVSTASMPHQEKSRGK